MSSDEMLIQAESLQNMMVAIATGNQASDLEYGHARLCIINEPSITPLVPRMVKTCRDTAQFWNFIKHEYSTYQERRKFIWGQFQPLLDKLEDSGAPSDRSISESLKRFDSEHVHAAWARALERRTDDPEGAITLARSLLESVCKHIIEQSEGYEYDNRNDDLPALYKKASTALNLAPEQHIEDVFKKILGGCANVVNGLGVLRNRVGDAHGQGSKPIKPLPRHAELAVNLSGSMASFLISTLEARHERS